MEYCIAATASRAKKGLTVKAVAKTLSSYVIFELFDGGEGAALDILST